MCELSPFSTLICACRMHPDICTWPSTHFYSGGLVVQKTSGKQAYMWPCPHAPHAPYAPMQPMHLILLSTPCTPCTACAHAGLLRSHPRPADRPAPRGFPWPQPQVSEGMAYCELYNNVCLSVICMANSRLKQNPRLTIKLT